MLELSRPLLFAMTRILALPTLAIATLELVSSLHSMLMTTTNAQLITAMQPPELFITMLSFVTITILALTNLAILKQDAFTHITEERIAMTITFVLMMDALSIKHNVFTLLLIVTIIILALLTPAVLLMDANTAL
jgi:hypothetical protein